MREPICRRYKVSFTLDCNLLSDIVEDPELKGALQSYEAIIDSHDDTIDELKLRLDAKDELIETQRTRIRELEGAQS